MFLFELITVLLLVGLLARLFCRDPYVSAGIWRRGVLHPALVRAARLFVCRDDRLWHHQLAGGASRQSIVPHVTLLTGVYALMQLVFAPLWGR